MADPLSVSVSIVAILGAAIRVSEGFERLRESRKFPAEYASLLAEVSDLHHMLRQCESHETLTDGQQDRHAQLLASSGVRDHVDRAKGKLDELQSSLGARLTRLRHAAANKPSLRHELGRFWTDAVTSSGKSKLDRFRDELRDIRLGLAAALDILTCKISLKVESTVDQLSFGQERVLSASDEILQTVRYLSSQAQAAALQAVSSEPALPSYHSAVGPKRAFPSSDHDARTMVRRMVDSAYDGHQKSSPMPNEKHSSSARAGSCMAWCSCQCHTTTSIHTPLSTRNTIGAASLALRGVPYLTKTCNEKRCRARATPSFKMSYRLPSILGQRLFMLSFSLDQLAGPELRVKLPRVVDWCSPVWACAIRGDVKSLETLFRSGLASPYDVNPIGGSLLHYATDHWSTEVCRLLLDAGLDPLAEDDFKNKSISIAWEQVLSGKMTPDEASMVASLFKDTEYLSSRSFTVIHKTVLGLVTKDLNHELECSTSDIDFVDAQGRTPLSWATARGDEQSTMILLKHGADPIISDDRGQSPLHYAKNTACAQLLVEYGAPIAALNQEGQTALHTACRNVGSASLVEYLLKIGVDVNAIDCSKESALHVALSVAKHRPFVDLLVDAGADINAKNDSGDSPVSFAIFYNLHRLLRSMLASDVADFSGFNRYGLTFAHSIARCADLETVAILKEACPSTLEPDTTIMDCAGKTCLEYFEERLALVEDEKESLELRLGFSELLEALNTRHLDNLSSQKTDPDFELLVKNESMMTEVKEIVVELEL